MSIHPRKTFIHANLHLSPHHKQGRDHALPYQPNFKYFFGAIIGTPEEKKLAQLMNRVQPQPVKG